MYKFIHSLSELTDKFGTLILLPVMVVIITSDVAMRYFINSPLVWGQEATGLMLFMFLFACQGNCFEEGHHIRMDVFFNNFPSWAKKFSNILSYISGIIFFGLIGLQGVLEIPFMIKVNETSDELMLPLWPFRIFMVLCCLQMVVLLIIFLFKPADQSLWHKEC